MPKSECEKRRTDPIAVVGMGCRFPGGADSPAAFWDLLCRGVDAVVDVPVERWNLKRFYDSDPDRAGKMYVRKGGFLQGPIDTFDCHFFGISPREAATLDPQQRLLLEVVWEALEDAGQNPHKLRGSNTGTYIGAFTLDHKVSQFGVLNRENIGPHTAVSSTMVMLSNRISYCYDFHGPSVSLDTACSSSLVALHLACRGLQAGDCDIAVTGGVNVMTRPEFFIAMSKGKFLARDGRCKTFDASADGYGRGEGCGVVVLKRQADAVAAGDRILALIAATGVNQDGKTAGITVPNGKAQQQLMTRVLRLAGVRPSQLSYIEAHGTGTKAGDPVEAKALSAALVDGGCVEHKVWVGSVKTNIGHLEAAAGIAAVIKTILLLNYRRVPPHLHLVNPNPDIDFDKLPLRVAQKLENLPGGEQTLFASINSFGYGGTNAHVVVQSAPSTAAALPETPAGPVTRKWTVPLSAQSSAALREHVRRQAAHLATLQDDRIRDWVYTLATRSHQDHRLSVTANNRSQVVERLQTFAESGTAEGIVTGRFHRRKPLVFVYTGMGPQWFGMGLELMEHEPVFRQFLRQCDEIWRSIAGRSLIGELFSKKSGGPMYDPREAQPANFALQAALTRLWESWGVTPDAIVGHSVGEISAAWAAHTLSLEDALRLTYHRCELQQRVVGQGTMLSVGRSVAEVQSFLRRYPGKLSVAAVNAPTSCALAGDHEALQCIQDELEKLGVFARFLRVSVAYHSHQLDGLEQEFMLRLQDLRPRAPATPLYSTVTGVPITRAEQDTAYWWCNARKRVELQDALFSIIDDGYDTFLEVGPHPVLNPSIRECLLSRAADGTVVSSLRRQQPERDTMLGSLGALYVAGTDVDWGKLHPDGQLLTLPTYPWDRQVLWEETKAAMQDRQGNSDHPLFQLRSEQTRPTWQGELSQYWLPYLSDHKVQDSIVFPGAGYVEAALVAATHVAGDEVGTTIVEDLRFLKALIVPEASVLRMSLDRGTNRLEIHSRPADTSSGWRLHATGKVLVERTGLPPQAPDMNTIVGRLGSELDCEALYKRLADQGLSYGPSFRGVRRLWAAGGEVLAEIGMVGADDPDSDAYHLHPRLLDPCFQSLLAAVGETLQEQPQSATPYLPVSIRQVRLHRQVWGELVCYGRVSQQSEQSIAGDLIVSDLNGQVVAEILGLQLRAVTARRNDSALRLRHALRWIPEPGSTTTDGCQGDTWAVIARDEGLRAALCNALRERECRVLTAPVRWGELSADGDAGPVEELAALLSEAWPGSLTGVVYVPAVDAQPSEPNAFGKAAVGASHCTELLAVVQALVALDVRDIKLAVVTTGAQSVAQVEAALRPDQGALWGFGRVIENEHPSLGTRLVDLDPADLPSSVPLLLQELLGSSDETEVAFRRRQRYVHRLVPVSDEEARPFFNSLKQTPYVLRLPRPGSIDNLEYQQVRRRAPGPEEVEIAVVATALNYKDLMKVMNLLPDAYLDHTFFGRGIGLECAGVVVRVGEGVRDFSVGDEVVCTDGDGGFRTYATVPTRFMVRRPGNLTLEQSVQFINLVTPYYGLVELAHLQAGETVLIHSACGGVGLGAVHIAQMRGARVIATAGSDNKRQYLRDLGLEHVSDSRSLAFVDDVLRWTNGRGVDVVFNSLQGEKLAKSFELLAPYGRFIEIGKRDINENEGLSMAPFSRNLTFSAVDIDVMMADNPQLFRRLVDSVWELLDNGTLALPPVETFGAKEVHAAFNRMSRSQHIGKIVLRMDNQVVPVRSVPDEVAIDPDASYLITGGWGGFGLEVSRWFASQGAKHLVILSRSGCHSAAARSFATDFAKAGGQLMAPNVDIADAGALKKVFNQLRACAPPIRGIVHSAAVLDDGLLSQLDEQKLWRVMAPKALGAWNLHCATVNQELDFFVCFSSVSSLVGNVGQGNYSAANAFLDTLAHYRRSIGLAGVTVNWGALAQAGMVARDAAVQQHLKQQGIEPIPLDGALQALAEVIRRPQDGQVAFLRVDWQRFAANNPGAAKIPRYAELITVSNEQRSEGADTFRDRLCAAEPAEKQRMAEEYLALQISTTLRLPLEKLETQVGLDDLGVDSLMAMELSSVVQLQTGVQLPTMLMMRGPTIAKLANELVDQCLPLRTDSSSGPCM